MQKMVNGSWLGIDLAETADKMTAIMVSCPDGVEINWERSVVGGGYLSHWDREYMYVEDFKTPVDSASSD